MAAASGAFSAGLALLACWAALGSRWFRNGVLVLMALAWATPGPVVGLGLKETILALLDADAFAALAGRSFVLWAVAAAAFMGIHDPLFPLCGRGAVAGGAA